MKKNFEAKNFYLINSINISKTFKIIKKLYFFVIFFNTSLSLIKKNRASLMNIYKFNLS